ncbi:MAG: tRNA preQ1(34) S-adenosylmethionine ribosyltransferase-isomerase QueA [Coprothermobacterota bacterium]|nr:tRNA preQ1(34) S-adenosylmethionine ribosyltransferase-isomerase QueA [Coprothermobacterota bacterium]
MTKIATYDYHLPPELIAQHPVNPRDAARLLVLDRATGEIHHRLFRDVVDYMVPGDLLVVNNTRVIAARLHGRLPTGGKGEVFLLRPLDEELLRWEALVRPGRKLQPGDRLLVNGVEIQVESRNSFGGRTVRFSAFDWDFLEEQGEIPLPPYIKAPLRTDSDYQTIFAQKRGAVAAPTAGLHFTPELIWSLQNKGVNRVEVTLHAGLGTFRPIRAEEIEDHQMHEEEFSLSIAAAAAIRETHRNGGKVFACGTTVVRALETAAGSTGEVQAMNGLTALFITPGFPFCACDAIITNFHLPKSTLLLLVSAFASRGQIFAAYQEAVDLRYRFFSFGDAMLIL